MFDLAIRQIVVMLLGMGALAAVTLVGAPGAPAAVTAFEGAEAARATEAVGPSAISQSFVRFSMSMTGVPVS